MFVAGELRTSQDGSELYKYGRDGFLFIKGRLQATVIAKASLTRDQIPVLPRGAPLMPARGSSTPYDFPVGPVSQAGTGGVVGTFRHPSVKSPPSTSQCS